MTKWRKVLAWETAQTVEELQSGDACYVVPTHAILIGHDMPTADKMPYWDDPSNWVPAEFVEWVTANDALVKVNGSDKVVHRYWLRTKGTPSGQRSLSSLRWEVEGLPSEESEAPEEFIPVDPIDKRLYRMQRGGERDRAIVDRIEDLGRRDDPSLLKFKAPFQETGYGYVYFRARSMEEAQLMLDFSSWDDVSTEDYEGFEITGAPELG